MKCRVCNNKILCRGLCNRHYQQERNGGIRRVITDLNEIRCRGNICWISLYNRRGDVVKKTKIDRDRVEMVKDIKWSVHMSRKVAYVYGSFKKPERKTKPLHRYLMEFPSGIVDHINRNTLDNRICNLRVVDNSTNAFNRSGHKYMGVTWHPTDKKWCAKISKGGRQIFLGNFKNKSDALAVRKRAEELYYPGIKVV